MAITEILSSHLPVHLLERARIVATGIGATHQVENLLIHANQRADYVLYWMRTAVRVDENPALDVARHLAIKSNLSLLVYHGLSQRYPFASDRHHTFILEGARVPGIIEWPASLRTIILVSSGALADRVYSESCLPMRSHSGTRLRLVSHRPSRHRR